MMKNKWGVGSLLLVSLVLSACGSSSDETSGETDDQSGDSEIREVEHAMGTAEIEGEPERVVSLFQGANDAAVALDVEPVAIVESWVEKPVYEYLRDDLEGVDQLGEETQPNLEEVAKQEPDVIFANEDRHEDIYDQLSQIAPTVMIDEIYGWKDTVDLMGQSLGKEEESDELLNEWDERVEDFTSQMEAEGHFPVEAAITNFRADHARIFYTGFGGGILNELGFDRPDNHKEDTWGVKLTSKESIPEMNADVIFNFNSGTEKDEIQQTYEDWTSHPLWQELDAVQNDNVHNVDEVTWNSAGGYLAANHMLDDLYEIYDLEENND
ncbi:ABC transporter substrate-binding protein [Halobacillus campisalis]|uniref:ABC transporter substrate-binding protein n=1 Tax=Halobacillus campisalis TaxID=435909 RepID=A0ABW2K1J7_9BACI|nr:iron-siderophore ABC transporter substrate-binding protein [Halobacillus campisalis]